MTEHSEAVQQLFLEMMVSSPESYTRVQQIFNPENFSRSLKDAASFIQKHADAYHAMPTIHQINVSCDAKLQPVTDMVEEHYDWFFTEFETFTKKNELERAILKAADLINKGETDSVEKIIKDAAQIGLVRDIGTDYFADPKARLLAIKNSNGQISTGWAQLDTLLYGGMSRGELAFFCGGSGSGKSLFLQNIAINWCNAGLNGVIITLELSEELTAMRIDSMVTGIGTREIYKNLDDVEFKVKMAHKSGGGSLQVKYLPAQSNVNHIRAYLKELQIRTKRKIDFLVIDYLDLMMPAGVKIDPGNLFIKDKFVSEEVRNLGKELNAVVVSAAQFNRGAVGEEMFDHADISGGITKIFTADNVFGIMTSRSMKEKGKYELQLLKTRSSSGVGQKVELDFDPDTLRIVTSTSSGGTGGSQSPSAFMKSVADKKAAAPDSNPIKGVVDTSSGEIVGSTKSDKLRNMISALKKQND